MILFNSFFPMSSSLAKPDTPEFAFWGLFLVVIQLGPFWQSAFCIFIS